MKSTILRDLTPCNSTEVHYVSKRNTASIFRAKEKDKQAISKKQAASKSLYLQPASSLAYSLAVKMLKVKNLPCV
jgi:hypothetical protein